MSRPIKTMRLPIKTMIDLNADVAEGSGTEEQLAPFCTSWNLCCGAHAGGPEAIRFALELARQFNIHCGAHPGHADKANFGRVIRKLNRHDLRQLIVPQLDFVAKAAQQAGQILWHLKLHGALYHQAGSDLELASETLIIAQEYRLKVFGLSGSLLEELSTPLGIFVAEGFADRGMDEKGGLLPREAPGGVLFDPTATAKQALRLAQSGRIRTLCVHGDSPNASLTLKAARNILLENHFLISPP